MLVLWLVILNYFSKGPRTLFLVVQNLFEFKLRMGRQQWELKHQFPNVMTTICPPIRQAIPFAHVTLYAEFVLHTVRDAHTSLLIHLHT